MSEQDVTDVTRNAEPVDPHAEIKLVLDLVTWVVMLYVMTHPDTFERATDIAREYWRKVVHHISVWTARQDIRSLPETEE